MNLIGLALLLCTFLYSAVQVLVRGPEAPLAARGKKIIRIAHWQLERGFSEAVEAVAEEYKKIHPEVSVIQIPVSEQAYFQWVNTQLVGGTAPDILAAAMWWMADFHRSLGKYFVPISKYVEEPNPYNEGTELEGIPWRETYVDGMYGSWIPELQEYYNVPYTTWSVRIYYNKDIFREALGQERPPESFSECMEFCERIENYDGGKYLPIAGSQYTYWQIWYRLSPSTTFSFLPRVDLNYDGKADTWESFLSYMTGRWSFKDPNVRAAFLMIGDITKYFQRGFMSVKRDQSVFLFVQGKAAMIATGPWDAKGLVDQSDFEVGVFDWPLPGKDHPKYGQYVEGRWTEAGNKASGNLAITKNSKHFDVALDFLRFFASQKMNEKFGKIALWGPAIKGAEPAPFLRAFQPNMRGYDHGVYFTIGGGQTWQQQISLYVTGQKTYEEFLEAYEAVLPTTGMSDMELKLDDQRRLVQRLEAGLITSRLNYLKGSEDYKDSYLSDIEMQHDLHGVYTVQSNQYGQVAQRLESER